MRDYLLLVFLGVLNRAGLAIRLSASNARSIEESIQEVEEVPRLKSLALLCLGFSPTSAFRSFSGSRAAAIEHRRGDIKMMGRKFENNKMKMAKSQLAASKNSAYIGKKIVVAVKATGISDPSQNQQLAAVMKEANVLNVPKEVVTRNVKKALDPNTAAAKEMVFEAYGHGGIGFIMNVFADNSARVSADTWTILKKGGCKQASEGSVLFNFAKKGRLRLKKEISEDELIELYLESGGEGDCSLEEPDAGRGDEEDVKSVVITEPTELALVQKALEAAGYESVGKLVHIPNAPMDVSEEDAEINWEVIDKLEELEDVTSVEHNMN